MPRINADNIAEHVANQQAALLDAAVRLFLEHGYHNITLGDIAADVGLARNSLYRYVPDKAHILVQWYHQVVPRTIDEWRTATTGDGTPVERVQRWALAYLRWAQTPEHALIAPLLEALPGLDDETRRDVTAEHAEMMTVVATAVAETGTPTDDAPATVDLLAGLVLGAARAERAGPDDHLRARLLAAITAILGPPPKAPRTVRRHTSQAADAARPRTGARGS